jgi:chromosome segregation ATPase
MKLTTKIETIHQKVQQLATKIESLEAERASLLEQNKKLTADLASQKAVVSELKTKLTKSQRTLEQNREEEPEHSQKLREQIDQYIKDIDSCIEWLQNS